VPGDCIKTPVDGSDHKVLLSFTCIQEPAFILSAKVASPELLMESFASPLFIVSAPASALVQKCKVPVPFALVNSCTIPDFT